MRDLTRFAVWSGVAIAPLALAGCSSSSGGGTAQSASSNMGSSSGSGSSTSSSGSSSGATSGSSGSSGGGSSGSSSGSSSSGSGSSSGASSGSSGSAGGSDAGAGGLDASSGSDGGLFNPTEIARVAGWLSNTSSGLESYAYTNIDKYFPVGASRDKLVRSIVGACAAFAPPLPNWQEYCEANETSQIVSESSYTPGMPTPGPPSSPAVNYDGYATQNGANDPTVGLLQVRFSSTVHDFNYYGPLATIEAIGCAWPANLPSQADVSSFWRMQGGTATYLAFMEDPACNIPLAAWNVFLSATGNGGTSVVYTADYCAGKGVAGNLVYGLLSFLDGPAGFSRPADPTNSYPAGIKTRFAKLLGGLPNPDPFAVMLSPEVSVYCK